jgi:tetratricopeptide (TPR) repeat protein
VAIDDLYGRACDAANKGNYEYAIELFRQVLRVEPEYSDARVLLRGAERRRARESLVGIGKVFALIKGCVPLVRALVASKNPHKKLELCEDFLEYNPNSSCALLMAGKAAWKAGLNEAAVVILKDLVAQKPEHKKGLRVLGEVLEDRGEIREALKCYDRLLKLVPTDRELAGYVKNLEAEAHMGETHMEEADSFRDMIRDKEFAEEAERKFETSEERRAKAIQKVQEELQSDPENINKILRLATLYEENKESQKAFNTLKKAYQKHPDNYEIREKLGDMQIRLRERKIKEIDQKLSGHPEDEELKKKKQKLESEKQKLSVREYKWRVKQHPTDEALRLKLGYVLFEGDDLDGAIESFQKASREPALRLEAVRMLGKCFMEKGQYDLAEEQLREAIDVHSEFDEKGMELYYDLAEVLEKQGKQEEALSYYKKIYSNDISFKDVSEKVQKLTEAIN